MLASPAANHLRKPTAPLHGKLVTDQQTTTLYILTTLAQSCAALAAFVGAVGVFRMQMLRDQRQGAERDLRRLAEVASFTRSVELWKPIKEIAQDVEARRMDGTLADNEASINAFKALDAWRAFVPPMKQTRIALICLEVWNLVVITFSLIGFNHVAALAVAPWFSCVLVVVAVLTALVPFGCVIIWTRGVEQ